MTLHPLDFFKAKLTETQISGEYDLYKDLKHVSTFWEKGKYYKHLEAATVELKSSILHEKETKCIRPTTNIIFVNKHKYIQDIKLFISHDYIHSKGYI